MNCGVAGETGGRADGQWSTPDGLTLKGLGWDPQYPLVGTFAHGLLSSFTLNVHSIADGLHQLLSILALKSPSYNVQICL